jgi:hypothetical protein
LDRIDSVTGAGVDGQRDRFQNHIKPDYSPSPLCSPSVTQFYRRLWRHSASSRSRDFA